jgi:hypothetical protein
MEERWGRESCNQRDVQPGYSVQPSSRQTDSLPKEIAMNPREVVVVVI